MSCPHNHIDCPCAKDCPRHGICCACVAHHRVKGNKLPACLRGVEWNNKKFLYIMNCKHFDLDNSGNRICKLGGKCDTPDTCRSKEPADKE